MEIKGRRIFNCRPMVFFALSLIFGILVAESMYGASVWFYLIPLLLFILCFSLVFAFKKSRKFAYIPIAILVGFVAMTSHNVAFNANTVQYFKGDFTCTVASDIVADGRYCKFYVKNISIDGKTYKYDGYVTGYLDEIDFNAGDTVKINGMLKSVGHERFDTFFASNLSKGVGFKIYADSVTFVGDGKLGFIDGIRHEIKKILYEYTDDYTASITQALVLGDKFGIDSDLYSDIKASGLAHVLAVSGLHVSTLATALYFVLKKLKVNPKVCFCVVVVLTFFYSMLCSFTASSLRAVVMSGVFTFASSFGQKKDDLSATAFAAILILLFRPYAIMDVGFLLSFGAAIGIFAFARPIEKVGMKVVDKVSPKRHIGKRFVSVFAVSTSANILTYPLVAYFFGEVPTLFLLSNFFVLPYVMAIYVVMLVLCLLSFITTWGGFVWMLKFLLIPFRLYVGAVGSLNFSTIPVAMGVVGILIYTAIAVVSSRYVFLTRLQKCRCALIIASAGLVVGAVAQLIVYLTCDFVPAESAISLILSQGQNVVFR